MFRRLLPKSPSEGAKAMLNLPLQCVPIQRSRMTRGLVAVSSGQSNPSQLRPSWRALGRHDAPFAGDDAVGPSMIGILGIPLAPFADQAAVNPSVSSL